MSLKAWLNERDLRYLLKDKRAKSSDFLESVKQLYIRGMPLPYILGKEEFYGLEFKVSPAVLIPRPETELVVEGAINLIKDNKLSKVLDLCSGSGNIGIIIKKLLEDKVEVVSSDVSAEALEVAQENARAHSTKIDFINSDLFDSLQGRFDLIISNPPYVETKDIKGSLLYEPKLALDGKEDGLYFIERIFREAKDYLSDTGYLILELGYNQKEKVEALAISLGYNIVSCIKDYSGHFRGIIVD